jgi:co-chaperonin GroES (HSP10)
MTLRPLPGNIFVEPIVEKHIGMILIPTYVQEKDMPHIGRIVAMNGARVTKKGKVILEDYRPGDKVLFKKFSGLFVEHGGKRLLRLQMKDDPILAILE